MLPWLPPDCETLSTLSFLQAQARALWEPQWIWAPRLQAGVQLHVTLSFQWRHLQNVQPWTGRLYTEGLHLIASEFFQWWLWLVAACLNSRAIHCETVIYVNTNVWLRRSSCARPRNINNEIQHNICLPFCLRDVTLCLSHYGKNSE